MTTSGRISQSAFDGSRLRVILLLDLYEGAQEQFLDAYEHMRNQVASVPGHLSDQLCQSIENPSQWLITSEWESAPPFLAWVNSEEHVETVRPMHNCVRDTRSMRYSILRETSPAQPHGQKSAKAGMQVEARVGEGVARHALTFTVKPGTESKVAEILAGYESPRPRSTTPRGCGAPPSSCTATVSCVRWRWRATSWRHCVTSPVSPRYGRSRRPSTRTWSKTGT